MKPPPEQEMTQASVLFEVQDGYALVTLNRPDKLNSFNPRCTSACATRSRR
jgi:enoyl-CoA hydratase/carnithine racemase